jgi:hypothetical protein
MHKSPTDDALDRIEALLREHDRAWLRGEQQEAEKYADAIREIREGAGLSIQVF